MNISSAKRKIFLFPIAVLYAIFLAITAIMTSGGGDGILFFTFLFSSPFSSLIVLINNYFPNEQIAGTFFIISLPVLWVTAVIVGTIQNRDKRRKYLKIFFICHYLGAIFPFLIYSSKGMGMEKLLRYVCDFPTGSILILGPMTIYLLGQIWLWRQLLNKQE